MKKNFVGRTFCGLHRNRHAGCCSPSKLQRLWHLRTFWHQEKIRCKEATRCQGPQGFKVQVRAHGLSTQIVGQAHSLRSRFCSSTTRTWSCRRHDQVQAPRMGVPTWFALRIAHVESGYNPRARGAAGELGVFQMKCQTARGLGFRGGCGQLLNASTGIHWGLKHLQVAVRTSRGNLKLAASKHNGGLGRKSLVRGYVNRVF